MALPSIDAFLELITKSGVVEPNRLTPYVERLRATNTMPADAPRLAGLMVRDAILTEFQAQQLLAGKWRGFFIGKYKVLKRLGSGGMGTVYLAEHRLMKRRVAIKVLPSAKAKEPSALERFHREAKASAALDHPNIVRAYDVDQDKHPDGTELHFLVMEYVEGPSLQDLVKSSGPLECLLAANYISQAAQGLQHAHAVGLVHRDIKPGNLLVDRSGLVKILDMGLARFFHDEQDIITQKYDENVLGTADYLAPEQALDSHGVDIRADIYSLGGTFYFLLTGRSPFGEGTIAQKLIWHQTRRPKPIRELRPEAPEGLTAVIEKMMAKDPAHRYQTPGEVSVALEPWAQQEQTAPATSDAAQKSQANPASTIVSPPIAATPQPAAREISPTAPTALRKPPSSTAAVAGGSTNSAQVAEPPRTVTSPSRPTPTPPSTPRVPAAAGGKGSSPAMRTNGGEPAGGAAAEPRTPAQKPAASSEPELIEPASPSVTNDGFTWDAVTDTASSHAVEDDTLKSTGRSASRRSRVVAKVASKPDRRRIILAVGIAGGVLLLAGVALAIFLFTGPSKPPRISGSSPIEPTAAVRTGLYVSKSKVNPSDFTTIREALGKAQTGDRIVVRDQEIYEESIVLSPAAGFLKRDIVIEAEKDADGKTAILTAPGTDPILSVERIEGLRVKGFTLDGLKRCEDLIRVAGSCPGTVFEDLKLQSFTRSGVRLDSCQGTRGRDVQFRNLRIESQREGNQPPAAAAITFGLPSKTSPAPNMSVTIQDCQFVGPYEATIRLCGPVLYTLIDRNLFIGGRKAGIAYLTDSPPDVYLGLRVISNTFWACDSGILIQRYPAYNSSIDVSGNLFYQIRQGVGTIAGVPPDKLDDIIVGDGNIYDLGKSQPGNFGKLPKIKVAGRPFDLPTAKPDAADFLQYPRSSPLATAGPKGGPVGALPPLP